MGPSEISASAAGSIDGEGAPGCSDPLKTLDAINVHLASLLITLAKELSFWVKSAACCAAGPLICAAMTAPQLNSPMDVQGHTDDTANREVPPHEDVAQVGSLPDQLALSLLGLYREAVLSPRSRV